MAHPVVNTILKLQIARPIQGDAEHHGEIKNFQDPFRGAGAPFGSDCAASRWDPNAPVADRQRDFRRTGKRVVRALSPGSLCRLSKERAEDGQAGRFR